MNKDQSNRTPEADKKKRKPTCNGRPRKADGEKKTPQSVYFTRNEKEHLQEMCRQAGDMPLSVFIHHQTIHGKVVEPISKEIAESLRAMIGIGNNINQFARYAHENGSILKVQNQLKYESKILANLLIHIADLCSQK
ncbi:plasmid mobilization relaxosome protein MobC [Bacteroides xylanisolvens]|uniref:plasmid mobilization protein n=1 Tax=Bacteroides xylanisolvens TaxID=371601 RepID=UPI001CDD2011|nr:plasmid mobilization relaxosome protein MobC [Bacteroides xylanisolvens]MCA4464651.1 plasmid mobilization relaxosome protein MobC [Bacteroides xylanisolvens]MCA4469125.1 plasmid mobilization relaxosome protein MobC [Bacteroides xylanisolvens]MCA4478389.1 plasmid mobilization relaxosome protein MobC [Bacteroides xylanisolvens]MCA4487630.1 plasmid mobilization relaxosome protein MobC [Bacteroides xylanisolvens]MCA4491890.1 plasmid mobilization relaxosome protein MobC [Bacteroides xylanisolven